MSSINRRNFLKGSSSLYAGGMLAYNDFFKIVNLIAASTLRKARADVLETTSKGYLNIHLAGGPSRYLFDQWLTPDALDNSFLLGPNNTTYWNPSVATAIVDNVMDYKLYTYKGVRVPDHFRYPIMTSKGAVSLDNLLDHMAVIRGYSSGTDGHEVNNPIQTYPDHTAPSLQGLAADNKADLISAVNYSSMPFFSGTGKVVSQITTTAGSSGAIGGLMGAFQKYVPTSTVIKNIDQLKGSRQYFRDLMNQIMKESDKTTANAINDHIASGEVLIQYAAEDLNAIWSTLLNKYTNTINKSAQIVDGALGNIPGLTDKPVFIPTTETNKTDSIVVSNTYDLRQAINTASGASVTQDFAKMFALYEYVVSKGISCVQSGATGTTVSNSKILNTSGSMVNYSIGNDQHFIQRRINVLTSAMMYRGLMGGLLELIDFLKSNSNQNGDLFSQTVIHITGDFARSPKTDGSGYDHGWNSQVTSVFSGAIQSPLIVGNIVKAGNANYYGTWGMGTAVDFNGSKELLSPRHVAAGIANLMGVKNNPWFFTNKIWQVSGNSVTPLVSAKAV